MTDKERGNALFANGNYKEAERAYSTAIDSCPENPEIYKLFTNRAHCYIKLEKFLKAVKDCDKSRTVNPSWLRAHIRKSEALLHLKRYSEAKSAADAGLALEPDNETLRRLQAEAIQNKLFQDHKYNPNAALNSSDKSCYAGMLDAMIRDQRLQPHRELLPAEHQRIPILEQLGRKMSAAAALEMKFNTAAAIKGYKECANQGCTASMVALGRIYFNGEGVSPDHKLGLQYLKRCIEHGPDEMSRLLMGGRDVAVANAHGLLGQAYKHGTYVQKDMTKAKQHLKFGAEGGCPTSMNNYGLLLTNDREGVAWFEKSAAMNYPVAMLNLADRLIDGRGIACDKNAAETWAKKALGLGEAKAAIILARLSDIRGDIDGMVSALGAVAESDKNRDGCASSSALMSLANALLRAQEYEDAKLTTAQMETCLVDCDQSLPSPSSSETRDHALRRMLATYRPFTDKESKACVQLQDAIERDNPLVEAGLLLGQLLKTKQRHREALDVFKGIGNKCNSGEGYYEMGQILTSEGPCSDPPRGMKYLLKASGLGSSEANDAIQRLQQRATGASSTSSAECDGENPPLHERWGSPSSTIVSEEEMKVLKDSMESIASRNHEHVSPTTMSYKGQLVLGDSIRSWKIMQEYVAEHPSSYSGWRIFQALLHMNQFNLHWSEGREEEGIDQLFFTYMFDEKAAVFSSLVYDKLLAAIDRRLRGAPNNFKALVVRCFMVSLRGELGRACEILTDVIQSDTTPSDSSFSVLHHRLLPRLLEIRGGLYCFTNRFQDAVTDFECAEKVLRVCALSKGYPA